MNGVNPFDAFDSTTKNQNLLEDIPESPNNPFDAFDVPSKTNEIEDDISSGEWTNLDSLSGALIFIEGATLGWSDEVGIGLASLAMSVDSEESQEEIYNRLKKDYNAMQKSFSERHSGVATGLEIAGAIVSPLSKIKAASGLTGLVRRGASEGAIYGAGKAEDSEDIGAKAVQGALGGALGAGVLGSAGWLFKRKVEAPLDTAEGFVPLTLAADKSKSSEALLQTFYRDVVGPSFGGKGLIRQQEEVIVGPLIAAQKQRQAALKEIKDSSTDEAKKAKAVLTTALDDLKDTVSVKKESIKEAAKESSDIINGNYGKFLGEKGAIINRATQQIQKSIDINSDAFRLSAFTSSLPAGAKKQQINSILNAENPNIAMYRLENTWAEEGFKSIKDRSFIFREEDLLKDIGTRISKNNQLSLLALNKKEVESLVKNSLELLNARKNPKTGRISGEALSAVRSAFGTAAASKSDVGGQSVILQNLYREVQQAVDSQMKAQMKSPKKLKEFEDDLSAWATHSVLKESVLKASTKTGLNGRFSPDDWLSAIKSNSIRQTRQGRGPLRAEAEALASLNSRHKETIVQAANTLSKKMVSRRQKEISRVNNKAKAERTFLAEQVRKQKTQLRNNPEAAMIISENTAKIKQLDSEIEFAGEELAKLSKLRTPENPSWYHSMAGTGLLAAASGTAGLTSGGAAASALSLGGAVKGGQALASQGVQRTLAGQNFIQQAAQQAAQTPLGSQAAQISPLIAGRLGGMLSGQ